MEKQYDPFGNAEWIYTAFRKAQSLAKGKPYRLPKDFVKHMNERMSEKNLKYLSQIVQFFLTKWHTIDPQRYFECGFELFNNFSYHQFADPRVMKLYVQRDKMIKRRAELSKRDIIESIKFIKKYIKDNNIKSFSYYCLIKKQEKSLPVIHYLNNDIERYTLVWLIRERFLHLTDGEMSVIPYVTDKYREILDDLDKINPFLKKLKEKL